MMLKRVTTLIALLAIVSGMVTPAMAQSTYYVPGGSPDGTDVATSGVASAGDASSGRAPEGIGQVQLPTDVTPTGINAGAQGVSGYEATFRKAVVSNSLAFQKKMNAGRVAFGRQMQNQYFNTRYWEPVTIEGQEYWRIKDGVSKAEALNDFTGSGGGKYKIDCAAAINLILLKSKLDTVGEQRFNRFLPELILSGWKTYTIKNGSLEEYQTLEKWTGNQYMPGTVAGLQTGDYVYFKNHPMMEGTPEQGENAIYLGTDSWGRPVFFGLNIGIYRGTFHQYGILSSERGSIDPKELEKMAES